MAIAVPLVYFAAVFVLTVSKYYLTHRINEHRYKNVVRHHKGNILFEKMNPKANVAEDYKLFTKPGGDEIYDLVHIGPGA